MSLLERVEAAKRGQTAPTPGAPVPPPGAPAPNAVVPAAPPPVPKEREAEARPAFRVSAREENFRRIRSRVEVAVADSLAHLIDLSDPEGVRSKMAGEIDDFVGDDDERGSEVDDYTGEIPHVEIPDDLSGTVGVTAGASAPEELVDEVLVFLGASAARIRRVFLGQANALLRPTDELLEVWSELCQRVGLQASLGEMVESIKQWGDGTFDVSTTLSRYRCQRVVIASGARER